MIKYRAFSQCTQLAIVTLGEGLEEIRAGAFDQCTSLFEILIPRGVKVIKDGAFHGCSSLMSVGSAMKLKSLCLESQCGIGGIMGFTRSL